MTRALAIAATVALMAGAAPISQAWAQAPAAAPALPTYTAYGPNITLEQALVVAEGAKAEAAKRKLPATIAIVDTSGALVYFQRGTGAPGTAEQFALRKAVAAVKERHATSVDQQRLKDSPGATPFLPDFFPFGGGFPLVIDGKVIGAIGETGGADEDVAKAGVAALK